MIMIVGQISSTEEALEVEFITKSLVVARRAKVLAGQIKNN